MQPSENLLNVEYEALRAIPWGPVAMGDGGDLRPGGALLHAAGGESGAPGRGAPLDLIEGHLTDFFDESDYRPALHGGFLVKNWDVHKDYQPADDGHAMVLKVQSFDAGGYEATCRRLNLEKIGSALEGQGVKRGPREAHDDVSEDSMRKSGQRAKVQLRHLVKNMGATNLLTLTRAEGPRTAGKRPDGSKWSWDDEKWSAWDSGGRDLWESEYGAFVDEAQWAKDFDKFRRLVEKALGSKFPYVAVLEQHRKGNFHLHIAWAGKVPINIVRRCWQVVVKKAGNVQAQYIKSRGGVDRSAIIARYISKYVSKMFESIDSYRFNKKRYWASRQKLPEVRRFILKSKDLGAVLHDLMPWMAFNFSDRHNFFLFPGQDGFWWNYIPEAHDTSPPPF